MSNTIRKMSLHAPDRPYRPSLEQFEDCEIDPDAFTHEAHVYVAWSYLQEFELLEAIDRYRNTLRRLTQKLGAEDKFHETITWFFLIAIAERLGGKKPVDFETFKSTNPDVFQSKPGLLGRHYSSARLMSAPARKIFLLPDLVS